MSESYTCRNKRAWRKQMKCKWEGRCKTDRTRERECCGWADEFTHAGETDWDQTVRRVVTQLCGHLHSARKHPTCVDTCLDVLTSLLQHLYPLFSHVCVMLFLYREALQHFRTIILYVMPFSLKGQFTSKLKFLAIHPTQTGPYNEKVPLMYSILYCIFRGVMHLLIWRGRQLTWPSENFDLSKSFRFKKCLVSATSQWVQLSV